MLPAAARPAGRRRGTPSGSSGSRTSSATARTPRPRSSSTAPWRSSSARRAAASGRSSRWSTTRGSTACSARPRSCAAPSPRRPTTPRTARVRPAARRPAADAERARRPLPRVRGRDRARLRLARAYDEADDAPSGASRPAVGEVLGLQGARRSSPRRSSASAATATSRSRAAAPLPRGPLNSIWEGAGNVNALDVLRALEGRRRRPRRSSPSSAGAATGPTGRAVAGCAERAGRRPDGLRARGSWSGWRSACRPRCSSATPAGSRTRSAHPGSAATAAAPRHAAGQPRRAAITERHRPRPLEPRGIVRRGGTRATGRRVTPTRPETSKSRNVRGGADEDERPAHRRAAGAEVLRRCRTGSRASSGRAAATSRRAAEDRRDPPATDALPLSVAERDRWAEWLLSKRFGGDRRPSARHRPDGDPNRVLDGAQLEPGETLLDVGRRRADRLRRARAGAGGDLRRHSEDLLEPRGARPELGVADRCRFVRAPATT